MPVVFDARDVARPAGAQALENLEYGLRRSPLAEQTIAAPVVRDEAEDVEIGQRLAGGARHFLHHAEAPLAVDERAFLFAPAGGGQDEVRVLSGLGRREEVLHDEEFETGEDFVEAFKC